MTNDEHDMDGVNDEALAAEYVLGVLPVSERTIFAARLENEPRLREYVEAWQHKLSPLDDHYEPVAPPASLKKNIDGMLFETTRKQRSSPGIWESLNLWRGLAFASLALLAIVIVTPRLAPPATEPSRFVVAMEAENSPVRYIAFYEEGSNTVKLTRLAGDPQPSRDHELWLIEGGESPLSLGVLPRSTEATVEIPVQIRPRVSNGAVLAISDEPEGGSPTGQATGPVVALGEWQSI